MTTGGLASAKHGGRAVDRLVFFSDAVIAIAITLLVFDLRLPDSLGPSPTDAELQRALLDLAPSFLSVALTFGIVAVWWFGHDRLFRSLEAIDGQLTVFNLLFLAAIAFLPFPTSVLERHTAVSTSVALYAGTNLVAGSALLAMRWHAYRKGFLPDDTPLERRRRLTMAAVAPVGFALSVPLAFINAAATPYLWLLYVPAAIALSRWSGRGPGGASGRIGPDESG